jgi:hypothetical protein
MRHREARHRIHQHQHVAALVAEIFGKRQREIGGLAAHQGRLVGGRDHDHGPGQPLIAQILLQEFLHLAAALADQANDRHVGLDIAGQHRQQHRLADAGAGENAHALAATAGEEGIECAHAEIERRADALPCMRGRRCSADTDKATRPAGSGPLPSIGSPMALTTRPSQPSEGRTAAGADETMARQPRRTPSSAPNGISRALLPEKPTTSPAIERPGAVSIDTLQPTDIAWIGPATSTISPRTPTTRP